MLYSLIRYKKDTLDVSNTKVTDILYNNKIVATEINFNVDEYKNLQYYPPSINEWFNSVYTFNKSYIKPLVVIDVIVNSLFLSYFNMLEYKKKIMYKRRSVNKKRYSANKTYVSRAEVKHNNTKIILIIYIFNKYKIYTERLIRKFTNFFINDEKNNVILYNRVTSLFKS